MADLISVVRGPQVGVKPCPPRGRYAYDSVAAVVIHQPDERVVCQEKTRRRHQSVASAAGVRQILYIGIVGNPIVEFARRGAGEVVKTVERNFESFEHA